MCRLDQLHGCPGSSPDTRTHHTTTTHTRTHTDTRTHAPQGLFEDPTILFVGDPELVELKAIDDEPLVVAQFACQQIKCTRDKFGNVVDGGPDAIQKVFYFWGLQQEAAGAVLPDGRALPPRWVIRDMMWQSMLALV